MDVNVFERSPVGHLVPISGHDARHAEDYTHFAFVPVPLPDSVDLAAGTWNAVTEAALALGRLDQAALALPNPSLLVRPAIRREAVSTSALEGTYATIGEVLEADFLDVDELPHPVREVVNYVKATERALALIVHRPIARNLICELHSVLVEGTRGDAHDAGQIRTTQVVIGRDGCKVGEARFVPPPPGDELETGLRQWEEWINAENDLPLLVKVALGHYQFETLHPFRDGNGRLGRLIAILQLVDAKALSYPVLNLAPWLEVRRTEYQDHLAAVSATGDLNPWVVFFSEAIRVQAVEAVERIFGLVKLKDELVGRVREHRIRSVAVQIAEALIGFPVLSPTLAASTHNVSYQTANTAIARLVEIGILEPVGTRNYNRLFIAPDVMRFLTAAN